MEQILRCCRGSSMGAGDAKKRMLALCLWHPPGKRRSDSKQLQYLPIVSESLPKVERSEPFGRVTQLPADPGSHPRGCLAARLHAAARVRLPSLGESFDGAFPLAGCYPSTRLRLPSSQRVIGRIARAE